MNDEGSFATNNTTGTPYETLTMPELKAQLDRIESKLSTILSLVGVEDAEGIVSRARQESERQLREELHFS